MVKNHEQKNQIYNFRNYIGGFNPGNHKFSITQPAWGGNNKAATGDSEGRWEGTISGIGSYCWNGITSSVCADYAGIPTVSEPLPANSTFTAHLRLPIKEPPHELQLKVVQVTNKDIVETGADFRLWNSSDGKYFVLSLLSEQDVNLSLEPGLYVLEVFPGWKEKGSASYGFLLKVR